MISHRGSRALHGGSAYLKPIPNEYPCGEEYITVRVRRHIVVAVRRMDGGRMAGLSSCVAYARRGRREARLLRVHCQRHRRLPLRRRSASARRRARRCGRARMRARLSTSATRAALSHAGFAYAHAAQRIRYGSWFGSQASRAGAWLAAGLRSAAPHRDRCLLIGFGRSVVSSRARHRAALPRRSDDLCRESECGSMDGRHARSIVLTTCRS